MNMAGTALNPAAGGPVGGGMMMMNNGGSPAVNNGSERNPEHIKTMLNTYVYEYFLKFGYFDIARVMVNDKKFEFRSIPSHSPDHRKDGEINGIDADSMDTDQEKNIPDDLPRPAGAGADSAMQGNGFLFEWFSVFSDLFAAHRSSHSKPGNPTPAMQYLIHHQQMQRLRENAQNANLRNQPGMMNPNFIRNGQMRNGIVNGEGKIQTRLTPQQVQMLQAKTASQMQQQLSRGEQPEGDLNARPATPADGDNGGSPSKRPRLENAQQFNPAMMPNGRPGVPGVGQQGMMIQAGFNPNMPQAQFRQNGGMPGKPMAANMANGMMNMPNAGSPMMANMAQFPEGMENVYRGMNTPGVQGGPNGQSGNHALQDYQMQLMLLEQQNKKRLMMARQEQNESTNPRDGQPMAGGVGMQPPGMSPSGRSGTSPNPTDQMKRTPQIGGLPGSPSAGEMQTRSPAPMNFMNGMQGPDFSQAMFMKDGQMMGPGGPGMRPPTSADMNVLSRQQQQQVQQAQQARMQFPNSQPMQQQPSQGQPQPVGTPGQRNEMPPPQAPAANNSAQRNNQPASPATSNAPPTPSQGNKPNPKKKNTAKDGQDRRRPTKKGSTANAPNADENPPATANPSTPITPVHPGPFNNSAGKGPGQGGPQPNQPPQQNPGMPPNQPQMQDPNLQNNDFSFPGQDQNFGLVDFSQLDGNDMLENFDFDSFLNTANDDAGFNFDGGIADNFGMDHTEG